MAPEKGSVTVDGRLDDAAWREARFFADFLQKEPVQGAAPTERTEIAFVYDGGALYIAARMLHQDPSNIAEVMTRRDEMGNVETLAVSLDTYLDRRTSYSFAVTAAGTRADWYHRSDSEGDRDYDFNPVWDAAAAAPWAVRPVLMARTGLALAPWVISWASSTNSCPFERSSRYMRMTSVSGSWPRAAITN